MAKWVVGVRFWGLVLFAGGVLGGCGSITVPANSCPKGFCSLNGQCIAEGQAVDGSCQVCTASGSFAAKTCPTGEVCSAETGQCTASGADATDATDASDGTDGTAASADVTDGTDGTNVTDGTDGSNATDGTDGSNATDGTDGSNVTDGTDGTNVSDGTDGTNTTDGTDATDGTDGTNATDGTDATDGTTVTDSTDATDGTDATDATDGTDGTDGDLTCSVIADCASMPKTGCQVAVCAGGSCTLVNLDAGLPCQPTGVNFPTCWTGSCSAEGECQAIPKALGNCDDGNSCTTGDKCAQGNCVATPKACSDGNPCTADLCDKTSGQCTSIPLDGTPCEDGNECTEADTCAAGACVSGANSCPCASDADCPDDGNLCNGVSKCLGEGAAKACVVPPESVVVCDTSEDTACKSSTCTPETGACAQVILAGAPCSDGNLCTANDACRASDGACIGTAISCNDDRPCTDDACVGGSCVNTPNTSACNDGNPCTNNDVCGGGLCAGVAKVCNDGNVCTADSCVDGSCVFTLIPSGPCDDGNICTSGDACQADKTCKGVVTVCNDNNPCTDDSCTPGAPPPGYTSGNPQSACVFAANTAPCNDGNACTSGDVCANKACKAGSAVVCPGGGPCKVASCAAATGCAVTNAANGQPCDDGNTCTTGETCNAGVCGGGTQCGCTKDSECDDGNLCNGVETCASGPNGVKQCKAGTAVICAPSGNVCQQNVCSPATGLCSLEKANEGASCGSDTKCVTGQVCVAGQCKGTTVTCPTLTCQVNQGCDPTNGCKYTAAGSGVACADGNKCTDPDRCDGAGNCVGTPITCDDGKACTVDTCSSATGCVYTAAPANTPCDLDGNACTLDTCNAGTCKAVSSVNCDDGVGCTLDSCEAATGKCIHTPVHTYCEDKNSCTDDVCTSTGCVQVEHADLTKCDDDNADTTIDVCISARCAGGVRSYPTVAILGCTPTDFSAAGASVVHTLPLAAYNYRSYKVGNCTGTGTATAVVYRADGAGLFTSLGSTTGTLNDMAGSVAAGDAGLVGLVSSGLDKVYFSGTGLHTALVEAMPTTPSAYHHTTSMVSTYDASGSQDDWYLLGGRDTAVAEGFALSCVLSAGDLWSCKVPKLPASPAAKTLDFVGSGMFTTLGTCGPNCYETLVGGGAMGSASSGGSMDLLLDTDGDLSFDKTFSAANVGLNYVGMIQVTDTTAFHYGYGGLLYVCISGTCKTVSALGTGIDFVGATALNGSVALLGRTGDKSVYSLYVLPAGEKYSDASKWLTYDLVGSGSSDVPQVVTSSSGAGLFVFGATSSGKGPVYWRFIP